MIGLFDRLSRPLLRALDPEDAHALTLKALRLMPVARAAADPPEIAVRAFGLNFPNPVGVAPGFDKNAVVPDALLRLGFGFVEVGTVTPRAQAGNPRPRIFRLEADRAVINRLGFNNEGAPVVLARLAARARAGGIVGVNIGANKDSADRTDDYVRLIDTFAAVASYFTVNVSSPNTPGLRDLQAPAALDELLARVLETRAALVADGRPSRPLVVKLAPDIAADDLEPIISVLIDRGIDVITQRDGLVHVTGHPRREELKRLYSWVKPDVLVPVHGEPAHLEAHAKLGRDHGIPNVLHARNGDLIRLFPEPMAFPGEVRTGELYLDGLVLCTPEESGVKGRRRLSFGGHIVVSLAVNANGQVLSGPELIIEGLPRVEDDEETVEDVVRRAISGTLRSMPQRRRGDVEMLNNALHRAIRSEVNAYWGRKPNVTVFVHRI